MKWRTADGRDIDLLELTHQHASNIIWFYRLLFDTEHRVIHNLINTKFNGVILDFKPLPIPNELRDLYNNGNITSNGHIVMRVGLNKTAFVGSVTHIPNWQELIK